MHVNDLETDKRLIGPGAIVEFTVEDGERGPKASNVRVVRNARPAEDFLVPGLEFREELTEALLTGAPTLTAEQLVKVRKIVLALVDDHGWHDEE